MKKKWIVTYYGPLGTIETTDGDMTYRPILSRAFRSFSEASHFRSNMEWNVPILERDKWRATVWHEDDVR